MSERIVPPKVAVALLAYGSTDKPWPPEILAARKAWNEAKRNELLFRARVGAVDEGMRRLVKQLHAELDEMYVRFGESLAPTTVA